MSEFYDQLPQNIQNHIQLIAKDFSIPDTEDTFEEIARVWVEKKEIFERQIKQTNLVEVDALGKDDEDGALVLTYSGSLVDIGPVTENGRKVTYTSIGYRISTPEHAESEGTNLVNDLVIDNTAEFENGPIKRTSQIYKIAVVEGDMEKEEKASTLTEIKTIIEDEFVEANKTLEVEK